MKCGDVLGFSSVPFTCQVGAHATIAEHQSTRPMARCLERPNPAIRILNGGVFAGTEAVTHLPHHLPNGVHLAPRTDGVMLGLDPNKFEVSRDDCDMAMLARHRILPDSNRE